MIILLSPAKSLNEAQTVRPNYTLPRHRKESFELVKVLRGYQEEDLMKLMSLSKGLAELNHARYKSFRKTHEADRSFIAVDTFDGDVYKGLEASTWSVSEVDFAQDHLRILSGLYGLLRPLDLMHPYRLEMGTRLKTDRGNNLYQYWDETITRDLNKDLKAIGSRTIINLASNEYFKAVKKDKLKADILTINFKEYRDGKLKFISFNAKKARGLMAKYIIQNGISSQEDIKGFNLENYGYEQSLSTDSEWLFVR